MSELLRWRRVVAATGFFLALVAPGHALAHASIDVGDGRYVIELGFRDEPAYLGQPNAIFLKTQEYATGGAQPVDGLADTLVAEVSKDGETLIVPLVPQGEGEYEGPFVPTAVGDYTFRISGTIGDAPVDESVTSGPNTFSPIAPLSAIEFPVSWPTPDQLQAEVVDARAAAATARTLGLAGIGAGVLGLILAATALARSGRSRAETASESSEPVGKLVR